MLLSNRVAIVTGGARGIGRGIALKFASEGCSVVIVDVLSEEGMKTAGEIAKEGVKGDFIRCDVSSSRQVQEMVDNVINKFGHIDILVNDAAIGPKPKSIEEVTEEEWDELMSINLKGVFLCCKAVVPHMKEKRYGRIINISSTGAVASPFSNPHYNASKAGVLGITSDLSIYLAPYTICINAILPGGTHTDLLEKDLPSDIDKGLFLEELGKKISPMRRMGKPQDIAGVALFLASDLSSFVNGQQIIVAGGAPILIAPSGEEQIGKDV